LDSLFIDIDKVPIWSHGQLDSEQQALNASSLAREDAFCFKNQ
jgi:hypothetical protein